MVEEKHARVANCIASGLVIAMTLGSPEAAAQSRHQAMPRSSASKESWQPCDVTTARPADPQAIVSAKELLGRAWLETDRGYFAAYTMAGEKRNPFDLSPKSADAGPRDGVVQARPPKCSWQFAKAGDGVVIRFTTPFYRFYEAGPGWSVPLRDGLMLEVALNRTGEHWQPRDSGSEKSILLPEQKPRAAKAISIPPLTAWAEPVPGCARRMKWNGETCVSRKK